MTTVERDPEERAWLKSMASPDADWIGAHSCAAEDPVNLPATANVEPR